MDLIVKIKNVVEIQSMSIGDKILSGLMVALIGMGFTFLLLMSLWGAINLLSKFSGVSKKEKEEPAIKEVVKEDSKPKVDESLEIVAVISAAISAFTGENIETLKIKSIKKLPVKNSVWKKSRKKNWR